MKNLVFLLGLLFGFWGIMAYSWGGEPMKVRLSALAGSWYPAEPEELKVMIKKYLDEAQVSEIKEAIFGLIVPHAGYQFSGKAAAFGFKAVRGKNFSRVILIGPSHYAWFRGVCLSSFSFYETPLGQVPVDRSVGEALSRKSIFSFNPTAEEKEHSLEIELPFLQMVLKDFTIVPLIVGELEEKDYQEVAKSLKPFITKETLVVVSSDFTHYGWRFNYLPFQENIKENLAKLDLGAVKMILEKDFAGYQKYLKETGATICGKNPIGILLNLLPPDSEGKLLNYYTSGDIINDYSSTVSYVSLIFIKKEEALLKP